MKEENCPNCKCWSRGDSLEDGTINICGTCYRYAPKPVRITAMQAIKEDDEGWSLTRWPITNENQFCGEFVQTNQRTKIHKLNLSTRAINVLTRAGIDSVQQLQELGPWEARHLKGLGPTSWREIKRKLLDHGIKW